MKALVALGNPGPRYRDTRHNVGWWLADRLVSRWNAPAFRPRGRALCSATTHEGSEVLILKPLTYVNRSGEVLEDLLRSPGFEVERDLLVLVDDIWLEPGALRIRARGSAGGHRGLASVERAVGTEGYGRLRIGVGRPSDDRIDRAAWVLSPMEAADEERVSAALDRAAEAVECWLREGMEAAMNRYNRSGASGTSDRS